jgi:hypothetical protein
VTAFDRKYHSHHFTCDICPVVFGAQDSYVEHEGSIYCLYHYATKLARICNGCGLAIMKQFVDIFRNGANQHWHPDCYMIHKYWNVRMLGSISVRKTGSTWTDNDGQELSQDAFSMRTEAAEATIHRIWDVLSAYEESTASALSDSLLAISNGDSNLLVQKLWLFIFKTWVLFSALEAVSERRVQNGLTSKLFLHDSATDTNDISGANCSREAKLLCKKCVGIMQKVAELSEGSTSNGTSTTANASQTKEILNLITGAAHYLKLLIRIGLICSKDSPDRFLEDMTTETHSKFVDRDLSNMTSPTNDTCFSCRKPVEAACFKTEGFPAQVWHDQCLTCGWCRKTGAFVSDSSREKCQRCGKQRSSMYHWVPQLDHFSDLLLIALARLIQTLWLDFAVLKEAKGKALTGSRESLALNDIPRLVESARAGKP